MVGPAAGANVEVTGGEAADAAADAYGAPPADEYGAPAEETSGSGSGDYDYDDGSAAPEESYGAPAEETYGMLTVERPEAGPQFITLLFPL